MRGERAGSGVRECARAGEPVGRGRRPRIPTARVPACESGTPAPARQSTRLFLFEFFSSNIEHACEEWDVGQIYTPIERSRRTSAVRPTALSSGTDRWLPRQPPPTRRTLPPPPRRRSPPPSRACSLTTRKCGPTRCSPSPPCARRHGVKATCTTSLASSCQRCSGCLTRTRPRCTSRPRWRSCHGAPRR